MRHNTRDETLKKNYIQKYQFLVGEYELIKAKQHKKYTGNCKIPPTVSSPPPRTSVRGKNQGYRKKLELLNDFG